MLGKISLISSYLPIIFFVVFCIKKATKEIWVIFVFCIVSIFFDLFLSYSNWAIQHTYLIWNLFSIVEYVFISFFFYTVIKLRIVRVLILIFSFFYLLFYLLSANTSNETFNSTLTAIESVVILILSLCYLLNIMKPTSEPVSIFTPVFLIVIGLVLFVSSTLFLFIIANNLSQKEMYKYWSINDLSNILTSLIFSAAFLLFYSQHKTSLPHENHYVDFTSPEDR